MPIMSTLQSEGALRKRLARLLRKVRQIRALIRKSKQQPTAISPNGIKFIAGFEGFVSRPKPDPVGYCTVGYGHLIRYGPCQPQDHKKYGTLTQIEALKLLETDLREYSDAIRDSVTVPLTQNQFDALVSFAYNNGVGAWLSSTLKRKIEAKAPPAEIRHEFSRWVNAGGRPLPGLVRRRAAEADLFFS